MKKALLVLGFALCGSFAFAQTSNLNINVEKAQCQRNTLPSPEVKPTDYKASIFAKDEVQIQTWDFAASNMTGINYGSNGLIVAGDIIDGEASSPHGQMQDAQMWQRTDSADLLTNSTWTTVNSNWKTAVNRYMQSYYTGNNNGFMVVFPASGTGTGLHNCYIGFPAVERPASVGIIDVRFIQSYYNFYDECYIDYKVGNAWFSREINIDGVDCDINGWGPVRASYTMPIALAQQANIEIRIRWYADGLASNAYGYFWAVDNVTLVGGEADRWTVNTQKFLDGFYGTMPQNMSIPMTWYGEAINNGANPRTNITLNLDHIDGNLQNSTNILQQSSNNIAPDPTVLNYMVVDERGFLQGEQDNRPALGTTYVPGDLSTHLGWWWFGPNYGATSINPNTYGLAGLPVSTLGQQFFAASASSTGADDIAWDTVAYQVVGETGGDGQLDIAGFRWGHDNGIIPSNSRYQFGYNGDYVTDETEHWSTTQYTVMNRFTTGNTIPENWVFRGVEIVPQTIDALEDIAGSQIYPIMWEAVWNADEEDWDLVDVATGFSTTIPYTVTMNDLNSLATGRLAPSDPYNAVNLQFFNQPVLKPNTSYYIGYQLAETGHFGAAKMQYGYLADDGQTSVGYYRDENPEVANGYYQFNPGSYDMYIYDPVAGKGYFAGYNTDYCAHIRAIVGPRVALTEYHINATCGDGVEIDNDEFEDVCGSYAVSYAGAAPTVFIIPEGGWCDTCTGAYVIDATNIKVDGNVIDIDESYNDFTIAERRYTVYNEDSSMTMLRRSYYAITFPSLSGSHSVSATATWTLFTPEQTEGIDPAAANVCLGLQPNPATSSVKLNISGVTGTVNCSIIDMSGRVIYNANINAEQQQVIDLSNVAAGAYFVRVTNDTFSKVEKLIVR
ncbi:MAG: T9SS type A sorting domain-containing protein [Bacteroidales bacterium]|nr:T9SS type A sorting domain-containing protein [Bacteroidales bacterium]